MTIKLMYKLIADTTMKYKFFTFSAANFFSTSIFWILLLRVSSVFMMECGFSFCYFHCNVELHGVYELVMNTFLFYFFSSLLT